MYKRIVIAVDESDSAMRAVQEGTALARALGGTVRFVHASHDPALATLALERAAALARGAGVPSEGVALERADASIAILEEVERWGADLVIVGSHARQGLERLLFGSVSGDVVARSPVPVLVVRQPSVGPGL
jgi:nucleotide-binding universal stress UspA family protein